MTHAAPVAYAPGPALDDVRRACGLAHIARLGSNESPFAPGPRVQRAVQVAAGELGRYGDDRSGRLRARLAERHGVSEAEIVVTNGSGEAIALLAQLAAAPGGEALMPATSFMAYGVACRSAGLTVREAPLAGWTADIDALLAAVTPATRVVFLANPGNPTGTFVGEAALRRLLAGLPADVLVVLDEAYAEYAAAEGCPDGMALRGLHPRLVVLRTFSKACGLAALRVGYAVATPNVATALDRARPPFNVNAVGQAAALAALDDRAADRAVAHNRRARAAMVAGLQALGLDVVHSAANFVLVPLGQPAAPVARALMAAGVIVRTLEPYGLTDALRVTVGLDDDNARFLAALESVLACRAPRVAA